MPPDLVSPPTPAPLVSTADHPAGAAHRGHRPGNHGGALTADEIVAALREQEHSLRAIAADTLTGTTIAGCWRIHPDDLVAWLEHGAPTHATPTPTNHRATRPGATAGTRAIAGGNA